MPDLPQMTEEKLSQERQKLGRRGWALVLAVAFFFAILVVWLVRQPIAEAVAKNICRQQQLDCVIHVARLDFGGVALRDFEVKGVNAAQAAVSGRRVEVGLDWASPFAVRARNVGGEGLVVRLDLTGSRPMLGDLDAAVKAFSSGEPSTAPPPSVSLSDVRVIGQTLFGPLEARGQMEMADARNFTVAFDVQPAALGVGPARVELSGGKFEARAAGDAIDATARLDVAAFTAADIRISDVGVDMTLKQSAGVLRAEGKAGVREMATRDARLEGAQASADIEAAAIDMDGFSLTQWIAGVQALTFAATSGAGEVEGVKWGALEASAELRPAPGGGSTGPVTLRATQLAATQGEAGEGSIAFDLKLGAATGEPSLAALAVGALRVSGVSLSAEERTRLAAITGDPVETVLPDYATAARGAVRNALADFSLVAPLEFSLPVAGGFNAAVLSGTEASAASGMNLVLDGEGVERVALVSVSESNALNWSASGSLRLSGGGGPSLTAMLNRATGDGAAVVASGALDLRGWSAGPNALSGKASNLSLDMNAAGGKAAGALDLQMSGAFAGGVWSRARINGDLSATWAANAFEALAPRGLRFGWDEVKFGGISVGAAALAYAPRGALALWRPGDTEGAGVLMGSGRLAEISAPVTGENFLARVHLNGASADWSSARTMRVAFDADPVSVDLVQDDVITPVRLDDVKGVFTAREGWKLDGQFARGEVVAANVTASNISGGFSLAGAHGSLDGALNGVTLKLSDVLEGTEKRFEPALFEGKARLDDGRADFSGMFALEDSGVSIGAVEGVHNLSTGIGSLTFARTPLIFRPRSFQPAELSPLLRGPADVTGRVDISGGASWTPEGFAANASAELRGLGFALANAGVFEGVTGKVEVSDLLKMTSAPRQTISIDRVTLGMPIEKGVIHFQLIGFDAIRLEDAEWPFAGGFIRVQPLDFAFGAESNHVVAQAVNWNLATLIELFKVPDVKVNGVVSGRFPVTFSTGSARIDNAVLEASRDGGVIQYDGSTGDAAASADGNAKMLFDALKDFRYKVLKVGMDGDLAGRIVLTLNLQGHNPQVLAGAPFDLNISIDSALMELLNTVSRGDTVADQIIESITGGQSGNRSGDQPGNGRRN